MSQASVSAKESVAKTMVPMRPFQAPPKIIDVTYDCQYEKQWIPILPVKQRGRKKDAEEIGELNRAAKWNSH
jgi:hypothetical protein